MHRMAIKTVLYVAIPPALAALGVALMTVFPEHVRAFCGL